MQEKFLVIENTLVQNIFARLHTANLSWPGMDTWARECPFCVALLIRRQYPSLTCVYMGYREQYTVLVFHLTNTICKTKQSRFY